MNKLLQQIHRPNIKYGPRGERVALAEGDASDFHLSRIHRHLISPTHSPPPFFLNFYPAVRPPEPFLPPLYFSNKFTNLFFSIYPAVSPPLGVRWEPDATLRFAPLTQHVLPQTPPLLHYFVNKFIILSVYLSPLL
ncbi:MAG: hypothetical protein RR607_05370 [Akkermansia sp.]